MASTLSFFPVGNGDMTLVELESGRKMLFDLNIRATADDPDDDTPDVANLLREQLTRALQPDHHRETAGAPRWPS